MEITVRGKNGKVKAKRGRKRVLQPGGGVVNQEINPKTGRWRTTQTKK